VHISSHGHDGNKGANLDFEMGKLLGRLQKLTKLIIGKSIFKDKKMREDDYEIRLIVLSACQSETIGLELQKRF
jgi:hypothetical protein